MHVPKVRSTSQVDAAARAQTEQAIVPNEKMSPWLQLSML
jgi:hypothetical protein